MARTLPRPFHFLLLVSAFGPGCTAAEPTASPEPTARDRAKAERAAFEHDGPTSYAVLEQQSCFCGPDTTAPMRVTVVGGSVTSATYVATGAVVPDNLRSGVKTIVEVFDLIDQQLADEHNSVTVTYDPVLHYPTNMTTKVPNTLDSGLAISLALVDTLPQASCTAIEDASRAAVLPAIQANLACKTAADCTTARLAASCFESCYAVIAKSGLAALQLAVDAVETNHCADYHTGGCTLVEPPCVPPAPEPYCTAGVCSNVPS